MRQMSRRELFVVAGGSAALFLAGCGDDGTAVVATSTSESATSSPSATTEPPSTEPANDTLATTTATAAHATKTSPVSTTAATAATAPADGRWRMPAEEDPHERTWMCWPSSVEVWAEDLGRVQDAIVRVASAIVQFEPVAMLCRPDQVGTVTKRLPTVKVIPGEVDDLWARDTLPNFVIRTGANAKLEMAAAHARFNGWGNKQLHSGDETLAATVAVHLGVELLDSGLVGEGGGIEVDGTGTVLAAASSWVNDNRNPGITRDHVSSGLTTMLGADRVIWVDGLAGQDITDGHIDTLARFAGANVILVDAPAFNDPTDPWSVVAARTKKEVSVARRRDGHPYDVRQITQPAKPRGRGKDFLSTYMNFYVCNGAVIAPQFGDAKADAAARSVIQALFPSRKVVMVDIDPIAAGGGGIHCATQQQPALI